MIKKHKTTNVNAQVIASPWNELDYYKEGQPIYGRNEEIWKVTNGIYNNLQTIIYGQSGIGKSSLLFAGVFPKLRKENYFPVFIRLGMIKTDYCEAVINSVVNELSIKNAAIRKTQLEKRKIVELQDNSDNSSAYLLWEFFFTNQFVDFGGNPHIPVLVFDQFEEVLNNVTTHKKAEQLLLDIYSLLDDTRVAPDGCVPYSNYRIVFSLREDYLYCFEDIIDKYNLNELRFNRHRITAMSDKSAKEVILKTSRDAGDCLERGKEEDICTQIIKESKNTMGEISTYMLSLICSTQYLNSPDRIIRLDSLSNYSDCLYQYYLSKIGVVNPPVQRYLEKVLITSDGRRSSIDVKDAVQNKLDLISINKLIETKLIRKITSGDNSTRIEYIHDKLTEVIHKHSKSYWTIFWQSIKTPLKFIGTMNQKEYQAVSIGWVIIFLCFFYSTIWYPQFILNSSINFFSQWWHLTLYYVFLYVSFVWFSAQVRRCHDIGHSGWRTLIPLQRLVLIAEPSSTIKYQGNLSNIRFKRQFQLFSFTQNEYKSITLQYALIYIFLMLGDIPFLLSDSTIEIGILLLGLNLLSYYTTIKSLSLYRIASSNISNYWTIIPIIGFVLMIRGFYKYKNEENVKLNNRKLYILSLVNGFLTVLIIGIIIICVAIV